MPGRLASPRGQAAALGLIFFFCFSAYDTIQVYAKRLYHGDTGTNSTLLVYAFFTVGCLFVAPVINVLGERLSIAIGVLCYASLVVAGLVDLTTGYADWLILLGGSLLGCGAALLWTAQGSLILSYGASEAERGKVFAIFWSLYRAAPLLGGLLSLSYFSLQDSQQAGSPGLFVAFLALIVAGACCTLCLRDPAELASFATASRTAPLLPVDGAIAAAATDGGGAHDGAVAPVPVSATATLRHAATDRAMLSLGLLFCASGYNEVYVLSELSRLVRTRAVGLEEICFYAGSCAGTHCSGGLLDRASTAAAPAGQPSLGALTWRTRWVLVFASLVHVAAFAIAAASEAMWASAAEESPSGELGLSDGRVAVPTAAFLLWGLSDGFINTWLYWLIGALHPESAAYGPSSTPREAQQRKRSPVNSGKLLSVAVYKMLNSAAHVVGYVLMNHAVNAAGWVQLASNAVLYLVALLPLLSELM